MSYHADRIRDDIERVASGDFEAIRDDLSKFAAAVANQGDAVSRLLVAHTTEFEKVWDEVSDQGDEIVALSNRIQGVTNIAVTEADLRDHTEAVWSMVADALDDLRAEVLEATATPFNPPEAPHAA